MILVMVPRSLHFQYEMFTFEGLLVFCLRRVLWMCHSLVSWVMSLIVVAISIEYLGDEERMTAFGVSSWIMSPMNLDTSQFNDIAVIRSRRAVKVTNYLHNKSGNAFSI